MTVESLMSKFTQYVSWLYTERQWATWELQTIAVTVMVLLLLILIQIRRARKRRASVMQIIEENPSTIGINLENGEGISHGFKNELDNFHIASVSKNNGNPKRWRATTKKWKSYQRLIEQLQKETALYKQAEQRLERQFVKLKAANEQLRQAIAGNNELAQELDLSSPRMMESPGQQKERTLNSSDVHTKNI
jgi:hypothetical protein